MKQSGKILLDKKIITQEQLDRALKIQAEKPGKYLGQILLDMGISQLKLIKALYYGNKRKSIGSILTDLKIITPDQLNKALAEQKHAFNKFGVHKSIGSYLIQLGMIRAEDYLNVLSIHFNMPIISLKNFKLSVELQKTFGEKYTRDNRIVVLQNNPDMVKIAFASPDFYIIEELEKARPEGKGLFFYLASLPEVEHCFEKEYDPYGVSSYK
jgi:hypothetical protein